MEKVGKGFSQKLIKINKTKYKSKVRVRLRENFHPKRGSILNKSKNLKRQSLRNREYYQVQEIQDRLYMQSKENVKFTHLMEIITNENNILLAYRNIKQNTGSKTMGTDGRTISYLANLEPDILIKLVQNKLKNYFPNKVRRVEIPVRLVE